MIMQAWIDVMLLYISTVNCTHSHVTRFHAVQACMGHRAVLKRTHLFEPSLWILVVVVPITSTSTVTVPMATTTMAVMLLSTRRHAPQLCDSSSTNCSLLECLPAPLQWLTSSSSLPTRTTQQFTLWYASISQNLNAVYQIYQKTPLNERSTLSRFGVTTDQLIAE